MTTSRKRSIDWAKVEEAFALVEPFAYLGDKDGPTGTALYWADEYVVALEDALERGDSAMLIDALSRSLAIHPVLLPLLGEFLRRKAQGTNVGRKKGLLRQYADHVRKMAAHRPHRQSVEAFDEEMASVFGVSAATIKRARLARP